MTGDSTQDSSSSSSDIAKEPKPMLPTESQVVNSLADMDNISLAYTHSRNQDGEEEEADQEQRNVQDDEENRVGGGPATGITRTKTALWSPSVKSIRIQILKNILKIWFVLASLVIACFSVYWGALYDRQGHLVGLRMLVVNEDYNTIDGIEPLIGSQIVNQLNTTLKKTGTYHFYNTETFIDRYNNADDISAKVLELVHHRQFWCAVHIKPNSTYNLYQNYSNVDTPGVVADVIYESGRDITNVKAWVLPTFQELQTLFNGNFSSEIGSPLISKLSNEQKLDLINSNMINVLPGFYFNDYRPYVNNTLLAPLQVGLIYIIILSFFLFNFFGETHKLLLPFIRPSHYVLYRIAANQTSYFVLALFISAVSAIFHIDFTPAFGKAGFVIYWFTNYLTMAAVGGANENMALILFTFNPPFVSVWLISWVILNISPSFSPMALTNVFYRYGYAFPVHNSAEIFKVIFLNLWKGELGRNYGILCCWLVVNNVLFVFILRYVGKVMAGRAAKAAAAAAQSPEKR